MQLLLRASCADAALQQAACALTAAHGGHATPDDVLRADALERALVTRLQLLRWRAHHFVHGVHAHVRTMLLCVGALPVLDHACESLLDRSLAAARRFRRLFDHATTLDDAHNAVQQFARNCLAL